MKTITVRGLEPSLAEKLKEKANKEKKSVNQLVIETIKQYLGMKKETAPIGQAWVQSGG